MVLSGDAENLSLIHIFRALILRGCEVSIYAPRKDYLSLYPFSEYINDFSIPFLSQTVLNDYPLIISGRNAFEYVDPCILISYNGIIISDDTCFYEGNNAYGDVIYVCGSCNEEKIPKCYNVPIEKIGCIKARADFDESYLTDFSNSYNKRILFVESGHYPYGKRAREELAEILVNIATRYHDYQLIITPRYLEHETELGKHSNLDHIYGYLYRMFNGTIPSNVVLLKKHIPMKSLIEMSDICVHTSCSAQIEMVYSNKPIVNIVGLHSFETVDFRKNRYNLIRRNMGGAGCDLRFTDVSECILSAKKAAPQYKKWLGYEYANTIENFCCITEQILFGHKYDTFFDSNNKMFNRLLAYAHSRISFFENRLDNFSLFNMLYNEIIECIKVVSSDTHMAIKILNSKIDRLILKVIVESWESISNNIYDTSFVLHFLTKIKETSLRDELLNMCQDTVTFTLYSAIASFEKGNYAKALQLFELYLQLITDKPFAMTDAETSSCISMAKKYISYMKDQV